MLSKFGTNGYEKGDDTTETKNTEVRPGTCPVCSAGCHVRVYLQDGQIIKVTGDPKSLQGELCERAIAAVDFHYHPQRINYPLKRIGERGEGKWQRIPWKQAMDEIAQKMDSIRSRFGPEAVAALGGGNPNPADPAAWRFCNLWGTPNYFWQGKNCGEAEFLAECAIYGCPTGTLHTLPVPSITGCALIWGNNPWASSMQRWRNYTESQKTGCKLVAIDPRRSASAEAADIWVRLRPGTDGALALGMLNVIINEGLYDKDFVQNWCLGFDELKSLVQKYPPSKAEEITWVPRKQIIEVATLYATSKPAVITGGAGGRQLGAGAAFSSVVGKCLLRAVTGNLEKEGGNPLLENPEKTAYLEELHWDKLLNHPLRTRDNVSAHVWPIASLKAMMLFRKAQHKVYPRGLGASAYLLFPGSPYLWSAILDNNPYPLRAVFLQTSNPLVVLGNARRIHQALKSPNLELYVTTDRWMTPSAMLSDYVLPSADNLERPYIDASSTWGFRDTCFAREAAVEPLYERKDDYYLWRDLGVRLGQEQYWEDTPIQWFDKLLRPTGVTFKEMAADSSTPRAKPEHQAYKRRGFATFSGKVELASSFFAKMGYPALPDYQEPPWSPISNPDLAREYPLILTTGGRVRALYHSQHRQIEKLRKKYPYPQLQIHPETAAKLGIAHGDTVNIETPLGSVRQKASLVDWLDPRVVHADGFWWYPEMPGEEPCLFGVWESNINAILPDDPELCDYAGDNPFRAMLCRVYKAKDF
ncbi:MAG: molybdopterin-dependent oxidoreductase [Dehalococcoidales bacterium]|nr:molybdopterin-dependent oxidoreductase [Dehalococcoidales bacterium]